MAVEPGKHCKEGDCGDEFAELCVVYADVEARKCGRSAAGGEQRAYEKFFWKNAKAPVSLSAGQMDSREISQRSDRKHGVPLANPNRHQDEDDDGGSGRSSDCQRGQHSAATPMKIVALAQAAEIV